MSSSEIESLLSRYSDLAPHHSFFANKAKPSVKIRLGPKSENVSDSRFGGSPAGPQDFTWPTHSAAEYVFLGQINFDEIVDGPDLLPKSGILTLFFADDESGELYWGEEGFVLAFYWPNTEGLKLVNSPTRPPATSRHILFENSEDIPMHEELRDDWPFEGDSFETLSKLAFDNLPRDYLLGYPSHYSLAYDPTPGADWIQLLALQCHEEFGWYWNDGTQLMIFIETEKLKSNQFCSLKCDCG